MPATLHTAPHPPSNALERAKVAATAVLLLAADTVNGHDGGAYPETLVTLDVSIIAALGAAALGYGYGVVRVRRRRGSTHLHQWQIACFAAGMAMLVLALVWPLDALSGVSFAAHMGQHMLLIALAPPLLVLGAPLAPFAAMAPLRRLLTGIARSRLTRPSIAFTVHAVTIWAWHAPRLFQAAVRSEGLHALEHLTLLASALLFWWSLLHVVRTQPIGYGASAVLLLLTMLHTGLLGALLTFAPQPLYPVYADASPVLGLTPLEDQQLAGLIMWVAGGIFYLVAGLALAGAWLHLAERRESTAVAHGRRA